MAAMEVNLPTPRGFRDITPADDDPVSLEPAAEEQA
jgi:hypothetical protein